MHQKMYMKALALYLLAMNFSEMKADSGPSIFFPITGDLGIGNPPKSFVLDIDAGSDLTWVPCVLGNPTNNNNNTYYNPIANVTCGDDSCTYLGKLKHDCQQSSHDQHCEYTVDYKNRGSFDGILVRDSIPLTLRDGTTAAAPNLTFGCGINPTNQNIVNGVLGLGKGSPGIQWQLSNMSVIRNAVGHCFSGTGGGYLFFGRFPNFGVTWKQLISSNSKHYYLGLADILLDGEATGISYLTITFDSGSTYTYLESEAYGTFLELVTKNLNGQLRVAVEDETLPVCWKDVDHPIENIAQVASYFKTVALNFKEENNVQFEMLPESYLIISGNQNVCLGILNGTEFGLEDKNVIGDISMQNKLVIYNNAYGNVGWAPVDTCNKMF